MRVASLHSADAAAKRRRARRHGSPSVGRPNVGKSTLFNRLVGRRRAIVDDTRRDATSGIAGPAPAISYHLLDGGLWETAGGEGARGAYAPLHQPASTAADIDAVLIDARAGIDTLDETSRRMRHTRRGDRGCQQVRAAPGGLAKPQARPPATGSISAEHGEGLSDHRVMLPARRQRRHPEKDEPRLPGRLQDHEGRCGRGKRPLLLLAIVGWPVGNRSTLLNRLIGEEVWFGPSWHHAATQSASTGQARRPVRLSIPPGMRRRTNRGEAQKPSVADTLDTIRLADVGRARCLPTWPRSRIWRLPAGSSRRAGRWSSRSTRPTCWPTTSRWRQAWRLADRLEASFAQVRTCCHVGFSALNGRGVERPDAQGVSRSSTSGTRRADAEVQSLAARDGDVYPAPLASGRRIRLRFMTQIKIRPADLRSVGQPAGLTD